MPSHLDDIEAQKSKNQEIWELTLPGRIHLEVLNHLGRPREITAAGKGQRIRISTFDRELVEERIRVEEKNPFRNGKLILTNGDAESPDAIGDADLAELFKDTPDEDFAAILADMGEVNIRRLRELAKSPDIKATVSQHQMIEDTIEDRFAIGGTTPTYDEIMRNPRD